MSEANEFLGLHVVCRGIPEYSVWRGEVGSLAWRVDHDAREVLISPRVADVRGAIAAAIAAVRAQVGAGACP